MLYPFHVVKGRYAFYKDLLYFDSLNPSDRYSPSKDMFGKPLSINGALLPKRGAIFGIMNKSDDPEISEENVKRLNDWVECMIDKHCRINLTDYRGVQLDQFCSTSYRNIVYVETKRSVVVLFTLERIDDQYYRIAELDDSFIFHGVKLLKAIELQEAIHYMENQLYNRYLLYKDFILDYTTGMYIDPDIKKFGNTRAAINYLINRFSDDNFCMFGDLSKLGPLYMAFYNACKNTNSAADKMIADFETRKQEYIKQYGHEVLRNNEFLYNMLRAELYPPKEEDVIAEYEKLLKENDIDPDVVLY